LAATPPDRRCGSEAVIRARSAGYLGPSCDVASLPEPDLARIRSERLGFVFQMFNLLSRTSAAENVALPLLYSDGGKSGSKTRFERAREALDRLGLGDRAGNTPGQLSGGQQQRVAIARALINSPSLLLADEPTGNLDTRTSHEIMQTLTQLNREEGVTIVLVTHEADIAAYANRTVTMRDGRILTDERKQSSIPAPPPAATDLSIFHPHSPAEMASGATLSWAFGLMILAAAAQALARNKMRSALTMLGVFIGVAALIAMVAIGQGANDAVEKQLASLGTNLVVIVPGAVTSMGARGGSGSASTLTVTDAQAIRREAQAVGQVAYLIRQSGQTEYASQNWTTTIQGVTPNYPPITNWQIASGRAISRDDESGAALVALLGQTVVSNLFAPSENPLGAVILVKGVPLRVIGTLAAKGQSTYGPGSG
jgi:macrolide transport system ATP-binding/permease protein